MKQPQLAPLVVTKVKKIKVRQSLPAPIKPAPRRNRYQQTPAKDLVDRDVNTSLIMPTTERKSDSKMRHSSIGEHSERNEEI